MTQPVFRFAPSPNGELHLGHALSALIGYERARACGGRFLLRIEDIDTGRSRPQFVAGILADLAWLGIVWEEPVVFQSQRLSAYRAAAERLERMGLLYPCFATRAEIEAAAAGGARDPDGAPLYPGLYKGRDASEIARRRAAGEAFALRIDMAAAIAAAAAKLGGAPLRLHRACRGRHVADDRGAARAVGRRGDRAQGHAGELSSGRGRRRRLAGRDPRHPRARSLSRHRPAPPAAGAAGSAGARLSPPPADHGRHGPQARQERPRHEPEIAARKRLQPRPTSAAWSGWIEASSVPSPFFRMGEGG